tara:strand:- start:90 stop:323 length:234 start_codon:yes stop_codon:yes gene_type:complete
MEVQSVLIKKKYYMNRSDASKKIRQMKFKVSINPNPNKEDKTHYRYRQIQPEKFNQTSFRTLSLSPSVSLIIGKLIK